MNFYVGNQNRKKTYQLFLWSTLISILCGNNYSRSICKTIKPWMGNFHTARLLEEDGRKSAGRESAVSARLRAPEPRSPNQQQPSLLLRCATLHYRSDTRPGRHYNTPLVYIVVTQTIFHRVQRTCTCYTNSHPLFLVPTPIPHDSCPQFLPSRILFGFQ